MSTLALDMRGLWAALPVPALVVDAQNRIAEANPAAEIFLNTSVRRLHGQDLPDRLRVDAPLRAALARVRADRGAVFIKNAEVAGHTHEGGARSVHAVLCNLQIAPLEGRAGAEGPQDGRLLVMLEPQEFSQRLDKAQARTASARSAIGMADMLAHEIKNPLAGITGAAQLLAMNLGREERELTDLIVAESRRIVALLEQVEQFGNLPPPERRSVNIHDILDRARKSALVGFAAHMRIEDQYDPSLPATYADPDQIMQVVLNLLKNAAEAAGPDGGHVSIRTFFDLGRSLRRREGAGARLPLQIEIADDGPGLPPEIAAHVFDPFVSGRENGTGLGLALVSRIIADHEGWISVESRPGRTVFRISLPVAQPSEGLRDEPGAEKETQARAVKRRKEVF